MAIESNATERRSPAEMELSDARRALEMLEQQRNDELVEFEAFCRLDPTFIGIPAGLPDLDARIWRLRKRIRDLEIEVSLGH